ncbi:MAG: hypothetical protein MUF25_13240 [Pirellulaceae bacterium]|jgi:hypothetical protein|nr:hypothetical protein [Pirellulaceae bacterium]
MIHSKPNPQITVLEVTDPQRIARHRSQDERHARNLQWLQAHWANLPHSRGRYVAVADQQPFVADTAEAAWEWARSQHPDDDGAVVMFVPREKVLILNNFRVIVSRPHSDVLLLVSRYRYQVDQVQQKQRQETSGETRRSARWQL